ncbi:DUF1735 and LamG domain-containing protein [uncultured Bacteroides sp.]|uniref:DUF1735 and LamG domain-containing protein n=1 Tax=uncultured Bacteroides sp. TaxID=162156 RepID=UPI0025DC1B6D|nr:DUF1735 and LamG domain-containing protein [uncultured Bacteroides sp.]
MKRIYNLLVLAAAVMMAGCDNTDYSNRSPFDNSAYLNVAEVKNTEGFTFNRLVTAQDKKFNVKLSYPAGEDVTVSLKIDPSLTAAFNAKNGTDYQSLDAGHYQLSVTSVVIPAGKTTSEEVVIHFSGLDELEIDATYVCPLVIDADRVGVMNGSHVMYYLVKRSSAITTAANLQNVYVAVPGFDKGSPTADVVNDLTAITMEAIIRVNRFDDATDISSIMGIEQYLCVRFGDVGFPRRQLQVQTPVGKFPKGNSSLQLQAGEWYHIALTWDLETQVIAFYVNGKLQGREEGHGKSDVTAISLGDKLADDETGNGGDFNFYFGRSYGQAHDISRQLNGEICEARIWSVARTEQQIFENMYTVREPAQEPDLRAYWRFDEGTGTTIIDHTGNGNDAKVIPYWVDASNTQPREKTDAQLWPSGIEVPVINN